MTDGSFNSFLLSAAAVLFAIIGIPGRTAFVSSPVSSVGAGLRPPNFARLPSVASETTPNGSGSWVVGSVGSILVIVGALAAKRGGVIVRHVNAPKKMKLESIPRPEKLLESPKFPKYLGSIDGYFSRAAKIRHAVTWVGPKDITFEMPTGGSAVMNKGDNLIYFRKKEQAIFLTKNLRKLKINDIKIYRIQPDGTVVFLHPLDGLWPENQTSGRPLVNWKPFEAKGNPQQGDTRWTMYHQKAYEADPLTTMFWRARSDAFRDQESLWPLPNFGGKWVDMDDFEDYKKKVQDAVNSIPDFPKSP